MVVEQEQKTTRQELVPRDAVVTPLTPIPTPPPPVPGAFLGPRVPFAPCATASEKEIWDATSVLRAEFPWWPGHDSFSDVSVLRGLRFAPSPRDLIVSTFVKTGTTWTTFIAHLLRSGGNVDFEEISQVVSELTETLKRNTKT